MTIRVAKDTVKFGIMSWENVTIQMQKHVILLSLGRFLQKSLCRNRMVHFQLFQDWKFLT